MNEGHKKLQIYQQAHRLAIEIHEMTMQLPSFERFEEGSQIRRSSKSVASNIVEGYALRKYKNEFVRCLFRAYGSCEETLEHLEILFETGSLKDQASFTCLQDETNKLCGKILRYIQAIDRSFEMPNFMKESMAPYFIIDDADESAASSQSPNPEPQTS
ncbi:MAG: four helix bundle protein [Bacteroidota bacterium]|jgi:four helix bundle protein